MLSYAIYYEDVLITQLYSSYTLQRAVQLCPLNDCAHLVELFLLSRLESNDAELTFILSFSLSLYPLLSPPLCVVVGEEDELSIKEAAQGVVDALQFKGEVIVSLTNHGATQTFIHSFHSFVSFIHSFLVIQCKLQFYYYPQLLLLYL